MPEGLRAIHQPTLKKQAPLWKEVDDMSDKELTTMLISKFSELQQIKVAQDRDKELDRQITVAKAQLEALGVVTENLELH